MFFLFNILSNYRTIWAYIQITRLDKPIGAFLLWGPSIWGLLAGCSAQNISLWTILLYSIVFLIGSFLMRGAGCVINDYWDQDIDRMVARTRDRPLADGRLNNRQALTLFCILCVLSSPILWLLSLKSVYVSAGALILIVLYPLMKRITYWPQLFLGCVFNLGIPIGYLTFHPEVNLSLLFLYLAGIMNTLAYDTIYAFQDIEDDQKIGVKSSAQKVKTSPKKWVISLYMGMVLFFGAYLFHITSIYFTVIGTFVLGGYIFLSIKNWEPFSVSSCGFHFKKAHRINLIIVFILAMLIILS